MSQISLLVYGSDGCGASVGSGVGVSVGAAVGVSFAVGAAVTEEPDSAGFSGADAAVETEEFGAEDMTESDVVSVPFDPQAENRKQAARAGIINFMLFLYIVTSFLLLFLSRNTSNFKIMRYTRTSRQECRGVIYTITYEIICHFCFVFNSRFNAPADRSRAKWKVLRTMRGAARTLRRS